MEDKAVETQIKVAFKVSSSVYQIPLADMPPVFQDIGIEVSLSEDSEFYRGLIAQFILQIIVEATSAFALEKFLLEPLLNLAKEKWKRAVQTLVREFPNKRLSYSLIIRVNDENLTIEVAPILRKELSQRPLELDEALITDVWQHIRCILTILGAEKARSNVRKIRIVCSDNKVDAICYENGKPSFLVDLDKKKLVPVEESSSGILQTQPSEDDDWATLELARKALRALKDKRDTEKKT